VPPKTHRHKPPWMSSGEPDSLQNDAKAPGVVLVQIKVTGKNGTMRNSDARVCTTAQVSQDLRLDERWGRSSYPKSKFSRIPPALRESWRNSTWRTMAGELHRFVLGIGVILCRPSPVSWVRLPDPSLDSASFLLSHNCALSCSDHIRQQSSRYTWCDPLEQEAIGLAFQAGAEWGVRTHRSEHDSIHQPYLP
jgi:hypothetical protein